MSRAVGVVRGVRNGACCSVHLYYFGWERKTNFELLFFFGDAVLENVIGVVLLVQAVAAAVKIKRL